MPAKLKIKVFEAKNLPVMDNRIQSTDAYIEVHFGDSQNRSEVCKKSLNPVWNYKVEFEVSRDSILQDQALELSVWDHDVMSTNNMIGSVVFELNALLTPNGPNHITGWFPIVDSLVGFRGQLRLSVRLEFFKDSNPFKDASAGVLFLSRSVLHPPFKKISLLGFVSELIVANDPEYHWADNFRASRITNKERLKLLYKLSGKLRRHIGVKVLELGGNAVLGFKCHFDYEGGTGIVVRGEGSAVLLSTSLVPDRLPPPGEMGSLEKASPLLLEGPSPLKVNYTRLAGALEEEAAKFDTVTLLTMNEFPPGTIVNLCGVVSARSVEVMLEKDRRKHRDHWWEELRNEVKQHAQSLGCSYVIGYIEATTLDTETGVLILTATGTAANLNMDAETGLKSSQGGVAEQASPCQATHVPARNRELANCQLCGRQKVHDFLFASVEIPDGLPFKERGKFIEARVFRQKKVLRSPEENAVVVSDALPFVEYEVSDGLGWEQGQRRDSDNLLHLPANLHQLYQQIVSKLKVMGMNSVFGFSSEISVGPSIVMGVMRGTALYLPSLPVPPLIVIQRTSDDGKLSALGRNIEELSKTNRVLFQDSDVTHFAAPKAKEEEASEEELRLPSSDDSEAPRERAVERKAKTPPTSPAPAPLDGEEPGEVKVEAVKRDLHTITIDNEDDAKVLGNLVEQDIAGFALCATQTLPGGSPHKTNLHLITSVRRIKCAKSANLEKGIARIFQEFYYSLMYGLKEHTPVTVLGCRLNLTTPREDVVQLLCSGFALADVEPAPAAHVEEVFVFEEEPGKGRRRLFPVHITPLSYLPHYQAAAYVGRVNVNLIREATNLPTDRFTQTFLTEILAMVQAQTVAVGANSLLNYSIDQFEIFESGEKGEVYAVANVSGDAFVVQVSKAGSFGHCHSWLCS